MKVKYWGTRGSIATPSFEGFDTVKYGGNTSCVEVMSEKGDLYIFDAGSGLRLLGQELFGRGFAPGQEGKAKIIIGHEHHDHIEGFPFFGPAYVPSNKFEIISGALDLPLSEVMSDRQSIPKFPIQLEQMAADISFRQLREGEKLENGMALSHCYSKHPQKCFAYRIEEETESGIVSLCYVLDNEHDGEVDGKKFGAFDKKIIKFIENSDLVVIDSAYTPEEYNPAKYNLKGMSKVGWGHAHYKVNIDRALEAGVKKLVLAHHDPTHDDKFLENMLRDARNYLIDQNGDLGLQLELAKEGKTEYLN